MRTILKKWPMVVVVAAMALTACSVVAERPDGVGPTGKNRSYDDSRDARRDDRRYDRKDDHRDDRRDDRRDDYRSERRDDRRDDYRGEQRSGSNVQISIGGYFGDRQRNDLNDYYRRQPQPAKCPPGLAKKNNGCQPPGQAKKWSLGRPLPRDVAYQPVEADIRVRLGTPPAGYEFVRVASDILMIAVGTSIVIDAIEDLGR